MEKVHNKENIIPSKNSDDNLEWSKTAGGYVPPQYHRSNVKCSEWQSSLENLEKHKTFRDIDLSSKLAAPSFFWLWNEILIWTYWAVKRHSDHWILSWKLLIAYLDDWFADTRYIMTNCELRKIVPDMLAQRYAELEAQYVLFERKNLNFYNMLVLKRHIEVVTRNLQLISEKYAQNFPGISLSEIKKASMKEFDYKKAEEVKNSSTLDEWKQSIEIKTIKKSLDWDFTELELNPSQLKDREIMDELWGYKLMKLSKVSLVYNEEYLEWIEVFLKSIHHISEFTLKSENPNKPVKLTTNIGKIIANVYNWTYELFALNGIILTEEMWKELGESFNRNRNNLCINFKNWEMDDGGIAYYFNSILVKPRILFLRILSITDNNMKDTGATVIAVWLQYFEFLNMINLKNNLIGDHGMKSLSKSFKYVPRLLQLSLAGNMITKKGIKYLCSHLHYLKSLTNLDLNSNQLKNAGMECIVKWVHSVKKGIVLNLKDNKSEDIEAIKDFIEDEENKKNRIESFTILVE